MQLQLKQEIMAFARKTSRSVFSVFFPDVCLACGAHVTKQGVVCAGCWPQLHFIEKPYCDVLGMPFGMDFGPGMVSAETIANPPKFTRARAATIHSGIARNLVSRLKYGDRSDLAPWMADWMIRAGSELIAESDIIVAVPLHRTRYFMRRYNQAAELARAIAQKSDKPFAPESLARIKPTQQQVGLTRNQRQSNVRGAFKVPAENEIKIAGRSVLLVDDVFTTGATLNAATKALLKGGAIKVNVLTFSQVVPDFLERQSVRLQH